MSSHVCATEHIKGPVSLIEKSRAWCPGGRFHPSFIYQGIIITGLNKLYDCIYVLALKMAPDADPNLGNEIITHLVILRYLEILLRSFAIILRSFELFFPSKYYCERTQ